MDLHRWKIRQRSIGIILVVILLFMTGNSVLADAAPPETPGGENIDPGEVTTMVQMVAEEVIVDVGATFEGFFEDDTGYSPSGYRLAYNCTFWMVNQGSETEQLAVRFPLHRPYVWGKNIIESIKVDGVPVTWREDEGGDYSVFEWAHFDVTFPPGEEVEIKVTYRSVTRNYWGQPHEWMTYTLETGAGWYGPIGKGKIILRLPHAATEENVLLEGSSPGATFTGTDVVWEFTDLEPTAQDNWIAYVISPDTWNEITAAREKLETSPNNISALLRLAEAIYDVCVYDRAEIVWDQPDLFPEGREAVARVVELAPNNVEYHERYAYFLQADLNEERYELFMQELAIIEELDLESELLEYLHKSWAVAAYEATQTAAVLPTATDTPEATLTLESTETLMMVTDTLEDPTPAETEKPTPPRYVEPEKSRPPLSMFILLVVLGFVAVVVLAAVFIRQARSE